MNIVKLKEFLFNKLKNGKAEKLFEDKNAYYYKNLCASEREGKTVIYDTTSQLYRPLTIDEMRILASTETDRFCLDLKEKNLRERFIGHRQRFHIAIAKNNEKEKKFFYKRCVSDIKLLRKVLY